MDGHTPIRNITNFKYAGFVSRALAGLVDAFVVLPFVVPLAILSFAQPLAIQMLIGIPLIFAYPVYNIYFLSRWGATFGKMLVKIKVVDMGGADIGLHQAIYRNAVDLALALALFACHLYALSHVDEALMQTLDINKRLAYQDTLAPPVAGFINFLNNVWIWGEMLVLLCNKKRRALHDFIASTVVVHKASLSAPV